MSANSQYELTLTDVNTRNELREREYNTIAQNLSNMEIINNTQMKTIEEQAVQLNKANDTIFSLSSNIKSKIATMSQMKLSEERLVLELNKLTKKVSGNEIVISNSASFETIKSALQEVFKADDAFCKESSDSGDFNKMSNNEICEIAKHMFNDYIVSKNKHMEDLKQAMTKMNTLKNDSAKHSLIFKDLANRINTLRAEVSKKDEEIQTLLKKCEGLEKEGSLKVASLLGNFKLKNIKIAELDNEIKNRKAFEQRLQLEITKLRSNSSKVDPRYAETLKEMKTREADFINKITRLQERMQKQESLIVVLEKTNYTLESKNKVKGNPIPQTSEKTKALEDEVMKLKEEMAKKEKEYNDRVQLFIKNLDGMKKQVYFKVQIQDKI